MALRPVDQMNELRVLAEAFASSDLLKPQDKELFESSSYQSVQHDINALQSQQERTKKMMDMMRIRPFLAAMEHLEKVLNALEFQQSASTMAYIWGPARFLLKTTSPTETAFDHVLDIYERLWHALPPLYEHTQLFRLLPECQRCLVYIYQDILTFHRLTYKLFSLRTQRETESRVKTVAACANILSQVWQKLFKATWKSLRRTFEHLTDSLQSHGDFIRKQGASLRDRQPYLHHRVDSGLDDPQDCIDAEAELHRNHNDVSRRRDRFEDDETKRRETDKKSVLAWISASKKTSSLHRRFRDMRQCRNTCRWLLRRYSQVTDWIKEDLPPDSIIWLHGSKGYGKIVLASFLIDELNELCTGRKKYAIPQECRTYYFYCQEGDPENCTYLDALKGILYQMVDAEEYLLPLCVDKVESAAGPDLATAEVAQSLIEVFFEYSPRQYVVIDGLDECRTEDIRLTATFFMKQTTKCDNEVRQGQLRVLFMSQPMTEMDTKNFMPQNDASVALKSTDNKEDIRAYVKSRIPQFAEPRTTSSGFNLSGGDKEQIESIICHWSDDMFLYAHLAIEYLLQQPNKAKILEKIKEEVLPRQLSEIYEKLLGAVKTELLQLEDGEHHWRTATRLLGWLVCAKRPLKWHEMQSILCYDPSVQEVDFDNKMLRQNVRKYLGSLVHVLDGDHIRMVHSTAWHYVIQNKYINEQAVQCDLAILCLRYLSSCFSKDYDENERRDKAKRGWFSFQDYACSQWHSHVDTVITACRELFDRRQEYEDKFGYALQCFVDTHRAGLTEEPHPELEKSPSEVSSFSLLSFHGNLDFLWNHIYNHQKGNYDDRNTVGISHIDEALHENRKTLEEKFLPSSEAWLNDTIGDYYGPNLFKCKRTLCKFFYLGYDKKNDRYKHNDRHERPYRCPLSCNLAPIGYSSKKDRDRHVRIYHPELSGEPTVFEPFNSRCSSRRFVCKLCGNQFTRNVNLKGHERSHFGDRPYSCSTCSKSFTRINDCQRHEKIHRREGGKVRC